jgi:hypothetical protein
MNLCNEIFIFFQKNTTNSVSINADAAVIADAELTHAYCVAATGKQA